MLKITKYNEDKYCKIRTQIIWKWFKIPQWGAKLIGLGQTTSAERNSTEITNTGQKVWKKDIRTQIVQKGATKSKWCIRSSIEISRIH